MKREHLERAVIHGFIDRQAANDIQYAPLLIDNQRNYTMSRALSSELRTADSFVFSVAFVTPGALNVLKQDLLNFRGRGQIITSNYLGFNSPAVYREMLNIPNLDVRVVDANAGFHPKGYVFFRDGNATAIVGSSNLTERALASNHEWNLRFTTSANGHVLEQLEDAIQLQLAIARNVDVAWVEDYERTYVPPQRSNIRFERHDRSAKPSTDPLPDTVGVVELNSTTITGPIVPNRMQQQALESLAAIRSNGEKRALVVSATGTGKTILAALDVRAAKPNRMLFLAHREQILDKAAEEFRKVLGVSELVIGKLSGSQRQIGQEIRFLFSTTNSFLRAIDKGEFLADTFDYVIIDEVHRAGAASYQRIVDFIQPTFMLGMSATPERTDGFNVFELFDNNLAFEIRLQQALEENMLAPFHYFGVTDYTTELGETSSEFSDLRFLASEQRADHLVQKLELYGQAGVSPRGLIFCSRNLEAERLSELLNQRLFRGRKLRTKAISGQDTVEYREEVVRELETGQLDYILSVDVFNEGIDIPSLNQIVMLRQTQSSIVFTQQLGRGLRKSPGKDYLIAIDFIGNYANNYLIPIALFGDSSRNKDQLRRKLIDVDTDHVIAGISSINFDEISKERVFEALTKAKLDSLSSLKQVYDSTKNRLGRVPMLLDYAKHEAIDPVVIGTRLPSYAEFVQRVDADQSPCAALSAPSLQLLAWLSNEFLNGKRPQELLLMKELLRRGGLLKFDDFVEILENRGIFMNPKMLESIVRILNLEWFTDAERKKYGSDPVIEFDGQCFSASLRLRMAWETEATFREYAMDVIDTGLHLSRERYAWNDGLIIGSRYTRKDVCRLLNWQRNEQATMYGYKVDRESQTCPIFVTYHKSADITESTRYEDRFLDQQTMLWYTRSRRTLQTREVREILSGNVPLHLFVKKDDAEGTDFTYLGQVAASDPSQTRMPGKDGAYLDVVTMKLTLPVPLDGATFDYFEQA